jgi:hypothetical protein
MDSIALEGHLSIARPAAITARDDGTTGRPSFAVTTALRAYEVVVARGVLGRAADYLPPRAGKVFVLTTADVWRFYGARLCSGRDPELLFFPGGEERKRPPRRGSWQHGRRPR